MRHGLVPANHADATAQTVNAQRRMPKLTKKEHAENLFVRADREEERGNRRPAFRLMLAAAKLGDTGAQVNVGNYYDHAQGIRRNRELALYWYKRAYRRGHSAAAHNIGVMLRKEGQVRRALRWFVRAVELGDAESNLEIGKHYLVAERNPQKAIRYLHLVKPCGWVTEAGCEEAQRLLKQARRMLRSAPADC